MPTLFMQVESTADGRRREIYAYGDLFVVRFPESRAHKPGADDCYVSRFDVKTAHGERDTEYNEAMNREAWDRGRL